MCCTPSRGALWLPRHCRPRRVGGAPPLPTPARCGRPAAGSGRSIRMGGAGCCRGPAANASALRAIFRGAGVPVSPAPPPRGGVGGRAAGWGPRGGVRPKHSHGGAPVAAGGGGRMLWPYGPYSGARVSRCPHPRRCVAGWGAAWRGQAEAFARGGAGCCRGRWANASALRAIFRGAGVPMSPPRRVAGWGPRGGGLRAIFRGAAPPPEREAL